MSLFERFPRLGEPVLIYAPIIGGIGIFEVVNMGGYSKAVLLGTL